MKIIYIFIISIIAATCMADMSLPAKAGMAASLTQTVQNGSASQDSISSTDASKQQQSSSYLGCVNYDDCLQNGLKERSQGLNTILLYYSGNKRDVKYNLFDNLSVRFSSNICPPIVTIFKKVNNINYMMDVFTRKVSDECTMYYSNITGDARNRDSIVGQLEVYFCNQDELNETCDQSIVYARENIFNKDAGKQPKPQQQQTAQPMQQQTTHDQSEQQNNSMFPQQQNGSMPVLQ